MDDSDDLSTAAVQLGRLALSGREQDVQAYLQRAARRWRGGRPDLAERILTLLRSNPTRQSPLRDATVGLVQPAPIDEDSRLELIRHEFVDALPTEPIWQGVIATALGQLLKERRNLDKLEEAGLSPTRTVLLVGPPGVGKTLAARHIAHELDIPLLVLDLAAVMSSLLGKTGSNLRQVMEYAKARPCVLLLDELDAVAKRRDDSSDVGELKRLVTVLMQAVDDWPVNGLLLGATNHPDLLDPAVWRRFEVVIDFPLPDAAALSRAVQQFFGPALPTLPRELLVALAAVLAGCSFNDIERATMSLRRTAALEDTTLAEGVQDMIRQRAQTLPYPRRLELAAGLVRSGSISQRRATELLHVSRDSIRRKSREADADKQRAVVDGR